MTTLIINASIRGENSISRRLSYQLADRLAARGETLIERDLTEEVHFVSEDSMKAARMPAGERTSEQNNAARLADMLILELQQADTIIMGVPIYNFGPPASVKAWADLVARAGTTFMYSDNGPQGLLKGKKAYLVVVSGGTKVGSEIDFMTPWLRFFLGFIGIKDVEVITADGIYGQDGEAMIAAAETRIERLAA